VRCRPGRCGQAGTRVGADVTSRCARRAARHV